MSEVRDQAIKLFGRNIPVPDFHSPAAVDECSEATNNEITDTQIVKSRKDLPSNSDEGGENNGLTSSTSTRENEGEGSHIPAEDQVLKRPDKILPCPRCNSLDTKFCYFNNYNVNQPRHFCKNCHRYWTAGGTMRNVPVGAGRRRNKHPSSQFRQVAQSDATSRPLKGIAEVLKFSKDGHLCESMAASLNLRDPAISVKIGSTSTTAVGNDGEEPSSSGCSSASTTVHEHELPETQMEQVGFQGNNDGVTYEHTMQCYPGSPWAYPWNAMMFGSNNNNPPNAVNSGSPPVMAISSFCPSSGSVPFVPASFWGCMPSWDRRNWNVPLVATTGCLSPSSSASNNCSGNNSPTLGKHSRDPNLQAEEKSEQSLWVPKTLRVGDPDEAAKSSIWDTLGIKLDNIQTVKKGGILKALQSKPKSSSNASDADADQVLQANPAAFSRSQTFQENT